MVEATEEPSSLGPSPSLWALCLCGSLVVALAGCLGAAPEAPGDGAPSAADLYALDCPGATPAWPDACTILASPNDSPSKTEVDLVINPTDPQNVVVASKDLDRAASDCVWSVAQVTKDGGRTWTTVYVGGDKANRHPALAPWACVTDPMMAFDEDGVLYYAMQAYNVGTNVPNLPAVGAPAVGSTFVLARSLDGGLTWDRYAPQHAGDGVGVFHDYPRMLVSPATGAVHTIWNGVGQAGVSPWVSSSRDGGETVDPPVTFWAEGKERSTAFASGFVAAEDGTLFVTAWTDFGERRTFHVFRSTDDARTFEYHAEGLEVCYPPRQLETNEFRTPGFVELAIDRSGGPHDGRIHATWADHCGAHSDVLAAWSDDGAATWSAPVRVNSDATETDQFFPRPKVGPDGTVHVLFADRRWDPENRLMDMTHAWSTDGGATWSERRLTASSFDGDLGIHQDGFPFIGDYNGVDAVGDHVWLAWGDTRTGRAEIAAAHLWRSDGSARD